MSFTYLPLWAVITGALTLVALLYVLQHFKAQPVVIKIASIQLWQEALQQASATTFWQRFRHWVAFITIAIIVLLLWLAFSGVNTTKDSQRLHLYYLDTSVAMTVSDNMAKAKAQLQTDILIASGGPRALWIGDPVPARLLDVDSPSVLAKSLLPSIHPSMHISSFTSWLDSLAGVADKPVTVHYYGAPYGNINPPDGVRIINAFVSNGIDNNAAIIAIGQQHYMDNNQQSARVAFTLFDSNQSPFTSSDFSVSLNGSVAPASQLATLSNNQFIYSGIRLTDTPQIVTVTLNTQDQFPVDNTLSIRLPAKTQLFIATQEGLPAWIANFISANPYITVDPSRAQVSLCVNQGDSCPRADATLYFDNDKNQAAYYAPAPKNRPNLPAIWQANNWQQSNLLDMPLLKISQADATYARLPLQHLGSLINQQNPDPLLLLWHTLHWLVNPPTTPSYMAVGEAIPVLQNSFAGTATISGFPLEASPTSTNAGNSSIVTIQSPLTSSVVTHQQNNTEQDITDSEYHFPWSTLAALIALLLLIAEWILVQRGRWA